MTSVKFTVAISNFRLLTFTQFPSNKVSIVNELISSKMSTNEIKHLVENRERHLFDYPSVLNVYSNEFINLSVGAPGPDILRKCIDLFDKSTKRTLEQEIVDPYLFQYGPTAGLWECREFLAKFLTHNYADPVYKEDLVLTCGASHGLLLALTHFLHPEGVIFVEEFTYMIALTAFKDFPRLKVIKVPNDEKGIDLNALETLAQKEKEAKSWSLPGKPFWALFYLIPVFHNPTGRLLPPDQCEGLIKKAQELDILLFCEDVYNLLHYDSNSAPPKRLFSYEQSIPGYQGGHVISNGSFSKILGPGVRLGWMEMPSRLCTRIRESGIMRSGGAVNNYVSGIIASALELGLQQEYLDSLIAILKERMSIACDCLKHNLPPNCSFEQPRGGYFVWVTLPDNVNAEEALQWCQDKYKVSALPGSMFSLDGKSGKNCFRLSISFHPNDKLKTAIERLCLGLDMFIKNSF